ncbi:unnamed protein product [Cunninghamella echinulata]
MGVTVDSYQAGNGKDFPKKGDTVTIHYTGTLQMIGVGQVIKGWDEGVVQLSVGEKARLTATSDYAYGPRGIPGVIPPNATLVFDVELIKIN